MGTVLSSDGLSAINDSITYKCYRLLSITYLQYVSNKVSLLINRRQGVKIILYASIYSAPGRLLLIKVRFSLSGKYL